MMKNRASQSEKYKKTNRQAQSIARHSLSATEKPVFSFVRFVLRGSPFILLFALLAGMIVYGYQNRAGLMPLQQLEHSAESKMIASGRTGSEENEYRLSMEDVYLLAFLKAPQTGAEVDHEAEPDDEIWLNELRKQADEEVPSSAGSQDFNAFHRGSDPNLYYIVQAAELLDLPYPDVADVLAQLVQGDRVVRLSNSDATWSKVMLQDGQVGFILTEKITSFFVTQATPTPEPTVTPTPSPSPKPVSIPATTAKPTRQPTPTPSPQPAPTKSVSPVPSPEPVHTPAATTTPLPTEAPAATASPAPTAAADPSPGATPQPSPPTPPTGPGMTPVQEQAVVELCRSLIGIRYKFASMSPSEGFDCSGLTSYVYKTLFNVTLPRISYYQAAYGTAVSSDDIRIGDILCFDWSRNDGITDHVGVYIGNGQYVHASSSNRTYYDDCGAVIESTVVFGKSPVVTIRRIIN